MQYTVQCLRHRAGVQVAGESSRSAHDNSAKGIAASATPTAELASKKPSCKLFRQTVERRCDSQKAEIQTSLHDQSGTTRPKIDFWHGGKQRAHRTSGKQYLRTYQREHL